MYIISKHIYVIYKNVNIHIYTYISKISHLFLNKLHFCFFRILSLQSFGRNRNITRLEINVLFLIHVYMSYIHTYMLSRTSIL